MYNFYYKSSHFHSNFPWKSSHLPSNFHIPSHVFIFSIQIPNFPSKFSFLTEYLFIKGYFTKFVIILISIIKNSMK